MEPGVIYTVEPGIYIQEGAEGVDAKYYNIGVRIEDTVLVTKDGPRNLSESAPREIADIEALMKKKGVGNFQLD
jgi:Xaa-Pro aminopeptidase